MTPVAEATSEVFSRFMDTTLHIEKHANITVKAMHDFLKSAPTPVELIGAYHEVEADSITAATAAASVYSKRQDADFVEGEKAGGFPLVYSQTAVSVWSALESHVDNVAWQLLANDPSTRAQEVFATKIKVFVGEYEALTSTERPGFLLAQLKTQLKYGPGVGRFEAYADALGLPGSVDGHVKRAILEFSAVRNVIVHRRGLVDKQALDVCPWLGSPGAAIIVKEAMLDRYTLAAILYAAELQQRIHVKYDGAPFPPLGRLIEGFSPGLVALNEGRTHLMSAASLSLHIGRPTATAPTLGVVNGLSYLDMCRCPATSATS